MVLMLQEFTLFAHLGDASSGAQCPRWDAFLERVLPDHDTRLWLQRFLGYCLTGDAS